LSRVQWNEFFLSSTTGLGCVAFVLKNSENTQEGTDGGGGGGGGIETDRRREPSKTKRENKTTMK